jgi:hypothetical protein
MDISNQPVYHVLKVRAADTTAYEPLTYWNTKIIFRDWLTYRWRKYSFGRYYQVGKVEA